MVEEIVHLSAAAKKDPRREEADEEITIERRVKMPAGAVPSHPTMRMDKIDARLLAMARGEIEPDDPFGGLIPIYEPEDVLTESDILTRDFELDDYVHEDYAHVQDGWLSLEAAPTDEAALLGTAVPKLRLRPEALLDLDLSVSAAFLVSHVDGQRTLQELNAVCRFDELESLELVDELLRMGAIELF